MSCLPLTEPLMAQQIWPCDSHPDVTELPSAAAVFQIQACQHRALIDAPRISHAWPLADRTTLTLIRVAVAVGAPVTGNWGVMKNPGYRAIRQAIGDPTEHLQHNVTPRRAHNA